MVIVYKGRNAGYLHGMDSASLPAAEPSAPKRRGRPPGSRTRPVIVVIAATATEAIATAQGLLTGKPAEPSREPPRAA